MVTRKIKPEIKKKGIFSILILALIAFIIASCQQSSEDSSVSAATDRTAPSTTVSVTAPCSLSFPNITLCDMAPIQVTFTANESATIYYAQGTSSGVSVSTSSSSIASGGTIDVTGTELTSVYVAFFAQDAAGNSESKRELIISIPDLTDPVSSFTHYLTADASADCTEVVVDSQYLCEGPITLTFNITDSDPNARVYYEATTDAAIVPLYPTSSSVLDGTSISIDVSDTYLTFFARDTSGNREATPDVVNDARLFEINGVTPTINSGYYAGTQKFKFSLSSNRTFDPTGYYKLYYLEKSGTDASADSTADIDSVFTSGASPSPNASAVKYTDLYPAPGYLDASPDITASEMAGDTIIYQFKYNVIHDGTEDVSGDVVDGFVDQENTLVLYIDNDNPKAVAIPPSSGSLSKPIQLSTHFVDTGHDKIEQYATLNPNLSTAAPLLPLTAGYCQSASNFTTDCDATSDFTLLTSLSLMFDAQVGMWGKDAAENSIVCSAPDAQYNCDTTTFSFHHFSEIYTPGMLQTSYYHENENQGNTHILNFGHAVAVADTDNDGTTDIIAISAPAYSNTGGDATLDAGGVYIWYNKFRERAILNLIDNDVTVDISNRYMEFNTDNKPSSLRIYLDPSTDSSGYVNPKFQAETGDYIDKYQATASEISSVLNDAFLSSFGQTYQNYLYADPSTDSKLSIGHINKTIQGFFTYSSNFDSTSDMYYSGSAIKAYDYAIYGENDNDEFGYAVAIGPVDTSTDTSRYSTHQIVVGAPGFNSGNGAIYVIRIPATDASADYGTIRMFDSSDDAYIVHSVSGTGRLGHAIVLNDSDFPSDGYSDIYTSAPYFDTTTDADSGAVYKINQSVFTYSDSTSDINAVSSDSYVWQGADLTGDAQALFGFSLAAGNAKEIDANPSSQYLFVGTPGVEGSGSGGKVAYFNLGFPSPFVNPLPSYIEIASGHTDANFGYSLAILNENFDDSTPSKCPCLVVGAPDGDGWLGLVWIVGDGYSKYISGVNSQDRIGSNLYANKIGLTENFDTLFIAAKSDSNKGHIIISRQQQLDDAFEISTTTNTDLIGSFNGDYLGNGLAIISTIVNGSAAKALIAGSPGESTSNFRIGSVRIYSGNNKLGY